MQDPIHGLVRRSHYYVSTVVPLSAEHAAVALERRLRQGPLLAPRVDWERPLPREAPAGTAYWPRLTVFGAARALGRDIPVEVEVWPWDRHANAEVGIRPLGGRQTLEIVREAWVDLATSILRPLTSAMLHPAGSRRNLRRPA